MKESQEPSDEDVEKLSQKMLGRPGESSKKSGEGPKKKSVPWDAVIPLDDMVGSVPPFPVSVFPQGLQDLVCDCGEMVGAPVDFPAVHALAVAAGVIGG